MKIMGQFSGTHISQTTGLVSFKFGMKSCIYGGHQIYKFDRNWPVVVEIRWIENSKLAFPVNNTHVYHMAFLVADT